MTEHLHQGQLTEGHLLAARAHVTAYYAAKGVVDFVRKAVFTPAETAHEARRMLMAAFKAMDLSIEALQAMKASLTEAAWWTLCAECQPLLILESQELLGLELARGIREASRSAGLPAPFAEGFIQDIQNRLA